MKMERIESSETSALKAQTPGDYPKKYNTAFNTRRRFEICDFLFPGDAVFSTKAENFTEKKTPQISKTGQKHFSHTI